MQMCKWGGSFLQQMHIFYFILHTIYMQELFNIDLKDDESSAIYTGENPVIYSAARNQTLKSTTSAGGQQRTVDAAEVGWREDAHADSEQIYKGLKEKHLISLNSCIKLNYSLHWWGN